MVTTTVKRGQPQKAPVEIGPQAVNLPEETASLVRLYYDIQRLRIKAQQRGLHDDRAGYALDSLHVLEKQIGTNLASSVALHPLWNGWLKGVKGIGPTLAAALLASGIDWQRCVKPSTLWQFAGVGMKGGKAQRKRRGEKRSYNGFLRGTLHRCITSFLMTSPDGFYAVLYYSFKQADVEARSLVKDIDHHKRASVQTLRVFLDHLLRAARELEGLPPPRAPYAIEKILGYGAYIPYVDGTLSVESKSWVLDKARAGYRVELDADERA